MKVRFYGTRGSIPVPEKNYMEFGGNTSCILLHFDNDHRTILDAGSGIRKLGRELMEINLNQERLVIALSHTHWDHIQGIPFFAPAYSSHFRLSFLIRNRGQLEATLQEIIANQMRFEYFPIGLKAMQADIKFWELKDEEEVHVTQWGGKFTTRAISHPGDSYGYRCEYNGKIIAYCTDVEHGDTLNSNVLELAKEADLLIHDAQYTPEELPDRKGWGHSSWQQAIDVAKKAGVRRLALFHHDPEHDDDFLNREEEKCRKLFPDSFFARESIDVEI